MNKMQQIRKRIVSGFTLLEMVVVVAIISILVGVLVPTATNYITRSRQNAMNSTAKILFNSLQTIMMEVQFTERTLEESAFYGTEPSAYMYLYCVNGSISNARSYENITNLEADTPYRLGSQMVYKVTRNVGGSKVISTIDALGANVTDATIADELEHEGDADRIGKSVFSSLGSRLSRLFVDYYDVTWAALIHRYTVCGVVCATTPDADYVGGYPKSLNEKVTSGSTDDAFSTTMAHCTPELVYDYCDTAWGHNLPS